jgi:hypothetical protein
MYEDVGFSLGSSKAKRLEVVQLVQSLKIEELRKVLNIMLERLDNKKNMRTKKVDISRTVIEYIGEDHIGSS